MKKKYDLIGFGEAMVRFTPLNHARLEQSSSLHLSISAAELNVAVNMMAGVTSETVYALLK
jgi:hypothetical protein